MQAPVVELQEAEEELLRELPVERCPRAHHLLHGSPKVLAGVPREGHHRHSAASAAARRWGALYEEARRRGGRLAGGEVAEVVLSPVTSATACGSVDGAEVLEEEAINVAESGTAVLVAAVEGVAPAAVGDLPSVSSDGPRELRDVDSQRLAKTLPHLPLSLSRLLGTA